MKDITTLFSKCKNKNENQNINDKKKANEKKKTPFRILAIDGGGNRGIIPSIILMRLEQITGKHPTELFDLFVGTSTGSIIAAVLTTPNTVAEKTQDSPKWKYSAKDLLDVYIKEGTVTFESSMWKKMSTINGIYGPMYYTKNRDDRFNVWLGDVCLKDTISDVVITAYNMCSKAPVFFKTRKARLDNEDDYLLKDVIKSATAAPTIWPPFLMKNELYMDALFGKNPTLFGIIEALKHYEESLDNIAILSLGTGFLRKHEEASKIAVSGPSFLMEVFNSTINANTMSTTYMIQQLLCGNSQMLRMDFPLPEENMGICDMSKKNIDFIIKSTHEYLLKHDQELKDFAKKLLPESEWTPIVESHVENNVEKE